MGTCTAIRARGDWMVEILGPHGKIIRNGNGLSRGEASAVASRRLTYVPTRAISPYKVWAICGHQFESMRFL